MQVERLPCLIAQAAIGDHNAKRLPKTRAQALDPGALWGVAGNPTLEESAHLTGPSIPTQQWHAGFG